MKKIFQKLKINVVILFLWCYNHPKKTFLTNFINYIKNGYYLKFKNNIDKFNSEILAQ